MSGKESVAYALQNSSLILESDNRLHEGSSQLQWSPPRDESIAKPVLEKYFRLIKNASRLENALQSNNYHSMRLLKVPQTNDTNGISASFLHTLEHVGNGGAMLAMKADSWPDECPRFCLFILLDRDFDDISLLSDLLRYTIVETEIYVGCEETTQEEPILTVRDKRILENWENTLHV